MTNDARPLRLWVLADNKPGHTSQLRGLIAELEKLTSLEVHWLDAEALPLRIKDWILKRWPTPVTLPVSDLPAPDLPAPDMVIGAGSASHGLILLARRVFGCMAVVLMRPSIPLFCYDAAIVPRHDRPPVRDNILITRGVMNTVQPRTADAVADQYTLLIGGVSKHFGWSSEDIVAQIREVAGDAPEKHWVLTNSRRTPEDFAALLNAAQLSNVSFLSHEETPRGWLAEQLKKSREVWVTPDSVSMVYEAITSGAATGLFSMQPLQHGRIHAGLDDILADGFCTSFERWQQTHVLPPPREPLHEASRGARWLLERYDCWRELRK